MWTWTAETTEMTPDSDIRVRDSIDHLFRHHAGQMVSVLSRIFGFERLDMIEDAVQDALVAALRTWPFSGTPDNPTAWLTQTARNRLIDKLRRDKRSQPREEDFDIADPTEASPVFFSSEINEDQLRMIFACCHPSIPPDSQVALTLKIVGGFSVAEIASAYLANDEAVAKMVSRAKARLRVGGVKLDIPVAGEITARLDAVLKVLYLMFNEGYGASGGNEFIRRDLCFEAIRLVGLLSSHPVTASPVVDAAAALFCFQGARLPARTDHAGELIILADQDRSLWDQKLIAYGLQHFRRSASGDRLTRFHLEAEIAAIYTLADDYAATDWDRILECYSLLQKMAFSPIVELNRIVVLGQVHGAGVGLKALDELQRTDEVSSYNLLHISRGHLLSEIGRSAEALESFKTALELTKNDAVRRFIVRRLRELSNR